MMIYQFFIDKMHCQEIIIIFINLNKNIRFLSDFLTEYKK